MKQHQNQQQHLQSKIIKIEPAFTGKWLGMNYVTYSVGNNIIPNYESVYRTTSKKNFIADGVQVIPIIQYKNKPAQIIVIANYRPPVSSFCLQFPSGLVQDQDYQQNMKRQLLQQTGYVCQKTIQFPTPTLYIDPWKSNQSILTYIGIINGDDPNHYKSQQLQKSQNIRVHKFVLDEKFPHRLKQFAKENNYLMQGSLWSVCLGLSLQKLITKP